MTQKTDDIDRPVGDGRRPQRVRIPGFVGDEDIGLGDVVQRATSYSGVRPCGGCEQRRAALNRWMTFGNRGRK
jgi:hypothetical protein